MTTRPGYIWSGTEWVSIGQEAVVAPVSYQTSAPSTPSTGDIWIDSNDDVPGIDTSQFLRWRKTMSGGETSVSGTDDTGLTLAYTANYEQVYLNGVLLVRGQDYTATNGTSITGLTALASNDVIEVFGVVARVVGDVYTQAQTNSLLDAKSNVSTTGLVFIAGSTFSAATTIDFTSCFSSTYQNYLIVQEVTSTNADGAVLTYFLNGTTPATAGYYLTYQGLTLSNTVNNAFGSNVGYGYFGQDYTNSSPAMSIASTTIFSPFASTWTKWTGTSLFGNTVTRHGGGTLANTNSYNGVRFTASAGTITGTIKVYGYK